MPEFCSQCRRYQKDNPDATFCLIEAAIRSGDRTPPEGCPIPKKDKKDANDVRGMRLPPLVLYNPNAMEEVPPRYVREPLYDIPPHVLQELMSLQTRFEDENGQIPAKSRNSREYREMKERIREQYELSHTALSYYNAKVTKIRCALRKRNEE